jgi:hypothetical protein
MIADTVRWMLWMRASSARRIGAHHRQDGQGGGQAVPEARLHRRVAAQVAAHQQLVAARQGLAHQHHPRRLPVEVDLGGVGAGRLRHAAGPALQVAGQHRPFRVAEQQDALAGDLQAHPLLDEVGQAGGALAAEHLALALRVFLQDFGAAGLDRHLPGVPEGGGEGEQRGRPEQHVADREVDRRGAH